MPSSGCTRQQAVHGRTGQSSQAGSSPQQETGKKLARDSSFNSLQLTGKGRADSKNNKAAIDSQRCNRRQTDE